MWSTNLDLYPSPLSVREEDINDAMIAVRRDIHAHPELRFEEHRTSNIVVDRLMGWGVETHRGLAGTGVVGTIRGNRPGRSIGLRADMDALPLQEANNFLHRSQHEGKMHACGHDGHVAMLLGAAEVLARDRNFAGQIHLIFQPGEEGGEGAQVMIDQGLFEQFPCDAIFALHNWPGIPSGTFAVTPGPIMASCNEFHITIKGRGAHAALPHNGNDPLYCATQVVNGLQSVITRDKRPMEAAVLSVTQFHAGETNNIIPETAWISGTVRTFSKEVLNQIEVRMQVIAENVCRAYGCEAVFEFKRQSPPTINNPVQTNFAVRIMEALVGKDKVNAEVEPTMGAEDFSYMLERVPGCYAFIGNGDGEHRESGHGLGPCTLHNACYDFNDEILPLGATYFVNLARLYLSWTP